MQEVKAAEEVLRLAEEVDDEVLNEIEKLVFKGAEELMNTTEGDIILTNVLENCSSISNWWRDSCDGVIKADADDALREVIRKAEIALNKKVKSYYVG